MGNREKGSCRKEVESGIKVKSYIYKSIEAQCNLHRNKYSNWGRHRCSLRAWTDLDKAAQAKTSTEMLTCF